MVSFQSYRILLEAVTEFKYIGRFLTAYDEDWPVVVANMLKAWSKWENFSRILGREGA